MKTALFLSAILSTVPIAARAENCEALARLHPPQTQITSAKTVPAGAFTPPHRKAIPDLPAFCRVEAVSKPSADSDIEFEVWLPASGWNGKFQGIGNGGFAGEIDYQHMATSVAHGYATASTDTGHKANGRDASWALAHKEKIVDFGHRAIHTTAVNAKTIIQAFYGGAPKRSYFSSCSNGGRQALMEAQRYPDDYNGIIAGAPAGYWTHLLSNAAGNLQILLAQTASYIPPTKLPAIESAALAACDAHDGVKDGVIEDPSRCRFDTSVLRCKGAETDACLTEPQITVLNQLYAGGHTSTGGLIFPGYSPGGEAEPGGWGPWIVGASPGKSFMYDFGTQFFKNMVFNNANWDFQGFNLDRDTKIADEKMAQHLNANDPDLRRFKDHGGKLILYHGWSDAAIAPIATVNYYRRVVDKMGAAQTAQFVRLFMVPGMQHCGGGTGPDEFGQLEVSSGDEKHSIDTALEKWVDGSAAPEVVVAAKRDTAGKTVRTRPLCAYPEIARYQGSGSTDEAQNFVCTNPQ